MGLGGRGGHRTILRESSPRTVSAADSLHAQPPSLPLGATSRRVATCEVHWTLSSREGAGSWGLGLGVGAPDNSPRVFSADCLSSLPPSRTNRLRTPSRRRTGQPQVAECTSKTVHWRVSAARLGEGGAAFTMSGVPGVTPCPGPCSSGDPRPPLAPLAPVSAPPETLWKNGGVWFRGRSKPASGGGGRAALRHSCRKTRPGLRETRHHFRDLLSY